MSDPATASASTNAPATSRLAHLWGVALLIGVALLFAAYLWSARESHAVKPVAVVPFHPRVHVSSAVEVIPFQHEFDPASPFCPLTPSGGLCFIIGSTPATPEPMTFT